MSVEIVLDCTDMDWYRRINSQLWMTNIEQDQLRKSLEIKMSVKKYILQAIFVKSKVQVLSCTFLFVNLICQPHGIHHFNSIKNIASWLNQNWAHLI